LQANREALAHLLFDEFKIPALFVANTSSLAIFGSGRVTGLVIDIGYAVRQHLRSMFTYRFDWPLHPFPSFPPSLCLCFDLTPALLPHLENR
jgi:hypothetical protein